MKIDRAKIISDLALRVSDDLNSILIELLKDADDQEYKKLIGSLLGGIYFDILRPVYDLYPALAPEDLQTK